MAQLVAHPTPDREVGSSILSGLTLFSPILTLFSFVFLNFFYVLSGLFYLLITPDTHAWLFNLLKWDRE